VAPRGIATPTISGFPEPCFLTGEQLNSALNALIVRLKPSFVRDSSLTESTCDLTEGDLLRPERSAYFLSYWLFLQSTVVPSRSVHGRLGHLYHCGVLD
jgi:hypothetical protein